jgi:hypothetical protein
MNTYGQTIEKIEPMVEQLAQIIINHVDEHHTILTENEGDQVECKTSAEFAKLLSVLKLRFEDVALHTETTGFEVNYILQLTSVYPVNNDRIIVQISILNKTEYGTKVIQVVLTNGEAASVKFDNDIEADILEWFPTNFTFLCQQALDIFNKKESETSEAHNAEN